MRSMLLDDFVSTDIHKWEEGLEYGVAEFPDGRKGGTVKGTVKTEKLPGNWTGYGSLQFTIYNPWDRPVVGGIDIFDQAALDSPDLEYGDYVGLNRSLLIGEGVTHVVIRIDPILTTRGNRTLDLKNIRRVVLHMPEPKEGEKPISISAMRLSQELEEIDEMSQAKPGDSILFIKNLDIKCYTYQPEKYEDPEDVKALFRELEQEKQRLEDVITIAEINGKQTHYARTALVAAEIALKGRPMLAWHFSPRAKRANLTGAISVVQKERIKLENLLSSRAHEDDEDDSNLPLSLVKPIPDLSSLKIQGKYFVDKAGKPVLLCAMSYHNEGALMQFFAPERHKMELYAVGGGSRYDIEWSPVYEAFHKYPGTERVGWKGWCGHLIKDQWAMGGRKENVVICLENEKILEAIDEYNRIHADDWRHLPTLIYVILAYELMYICYCDESLRRFRIWLKERHGTIEVLNEKWGTDYKNFEEVVPPPCESGAPEPGINRAAWFDWTDWNTRRFTDHLKWCRDSIRKLHPTMPICAGGTSSMFSSNNGTTGIDEEMIINEVDDVILHEGRDIMGVDLFQALAETPKPIVDPEFGGNERWMLNYLHGKSTISVFWWPKQPSRQFPRSTLVAPLHGTMPVEKIAGNLCTALDIRRLNEEITAFWEIPKEVALLYSKTNILQVDPVLISANTTPYLAALRQSYESARCLDAGITFISEKQLLKGRAGKFKLLVLPSVQYFPEKAFNAIDEYIQGGGNVLVIPEALTHDEYNRPMNYLERWGIKIKHADTLTISGFGQYEQQYDQSMERAVEFEEGKEVTAAEFSEAMEPFDFTISGVFQHIDANGGEVVARGPEGQPMLLSIPRGSGRIWYLAGTPEPSSLMMLLDRLFEEVGVDRSFKVTDKDGNRVPGLEARLARRKFDDLIYVSNESGKDVDFTIQTTRPYYRIRELRSLEYYDKPQGTIKNGEVLIFSFKEDPAAMVRKKI